MVSGYLEAVYFAADADEVTTAMRARAASRTKPSALNLYLMGFLPLLSREEDLTAKSLTVN